MVSDGARMQQRPMLELGCCLSGVAQEEAHEPRRGSQDIGAPPSNLRRKIDPEPEIVNYDRGPQLSQRCGAPNPGRVPRRARALRRGGKAAAAGEHGGEHAITMVVCLRHFGAVHVEGEVREALFERADVRPTACVFFFVRLAASLGVQPSGVCYVNHNTLVHDVLADHLQSKDEPCTDRSIWSITAVSQVKTTSARANGTAIVVGPYLPFPPLLSRFVFRTGT